MCLASAALAFGLASSPAAAATILVTTESGITNDGLLDWGVLGGNFSVVSNPFTTSVPGIAGLTITGSKSSGNFERRDQPFGWAGNFGPGEELLWTSGDSGPMIFAFNGGIAGFGAQIQRNTFGPFTARIEAFDSSANSLGFFTLAGNSTSDADDSAIFVGILSDSNDIFRISIGVIGDQDFAINDPRIQGDGVTIAPEPASLVLFGIGIAGIGMRRVNRPRE